MKVYKVIVKTMGPVHVGSGEKRNKLNYIWNKGENKIYIPHDTKFMAWIIEKGLIQSFEKYIFGKNSDIYLWLKQQGLLKEYRNVMAYSLTTDSIKIKGNVKLNDIHMQIKDSHLNPYIPGSSLKGALRTVLFGEYLHGLKEDKNYEKIKFIDKYLRDRGKPRDRIKTLSAESVKLEKEYFNVGDKKSEKEYFNKEEKKDAINSFMKHLLISDSKPISNKNLVLAQKIDTHTDGKYNAQPLFRESIKPGVEIIFEMVIKEDFPLDIYDIEDAIYNFYRDMDYSFLSFFDVPEREGEYIYLGGGPGYISKTNIYQLLDEKKALKTVSKILDDKHRGKKHLEDEKRGVSPRVLKQTIVNGKLLEMGLCSISFEEVK